MRQPWELTPFGKDSPSPWTFIYPHRNPRTLPSGYSPNEAEARQYRGLILTPIYDVVAANVMLSWWELRHAHSAELMFFIKADGDEVAEHFDRLVADLANWEHMRSVPPSEAPPHSHVLIDFLNSTKDVFYALDCELLFPELEMRIWMAMFPMDAAKYTEGVGMSIEQHLVGLQQIGSDDEGSAIAELGVRHLQLGALTADDGPVFRPVELESLARGKTKRQEGPAS